MSYIASFCSKTNEELCENPSAPVGATHFLYMTYRTKRTAKNVRRDISDLEYIYYVYDLLGGGATQGVLMTSE
jgi:hypothetical protein